MSWKAEGRGTLTNFISWAGRLSWVRGWLCVPEKENARLELGGPMIS